MTTPQNFAELIGRITDLFYLAVPILVGLAVLYFFWGIADWIFNLSTGDAEKGKKGRERMIWGILALFFMLSIAGIVSVLSNTFINPTAPATEEDSLFDFRGSIY